MKKEENTVFVFRSSTEWRSRIKQSKVDGPMGENEVLNYGYSIKGCTFKWNFNGCVTQNGKTIYGGKEKEDICAEFSLKTASIFFVQHKFEQAFVTSVQNKYTGLSPHYFQSLIDQII